MFHPHLLTIRMEGFTDELGAIVCAKNQRDLPLTHLAGFYCLLYGFQDLWRAAGRTPVVGNNIPVKHIDDASQKKCLR